MSPFEPVGTEARWRTIYRALRDTPTGEILTYEQLGEALGLDPVKNRGAITAPMRRAAQEHEEVDKRTIEAIPDEGYRVLDVGGQLRLARTRGRKAGTQLELAHSAAVNVDLSGVDLEVRKGFEVLAIGYMELKDANRRMLSRQRRMERTIRAVEEGSGQTAEEVEELKARLAALEQRAS